MQPSFEKSEADETELFARDASSLAPIAIDRTPLPTSTTTTTESLQRLVETVNVRPKPGSDKRLITGAAIAFVALSLVSAVALRVPPPALRSSAVPRTPRGVAAHEAVMIPALTAPAKDLILLDEDDASAIPVSALPALQAQHVASVTPARRAPQGGLLRVPATVKGILVDGAPHRAERGLVAIPCGTHTIKAPSQPARSVTIACGGTTTL